jgi:hypothetical protein
MRSGAAYRELTCIIARRRAVIHRLFPAQRSTPTPRWSRWARHPPSPSAPPTCTSGSPPAEKGDLSDTEIADRLRDAVTFPGAGHGLLDNPLADPDAIPTLIDWVTRHGQ